MPAQSGIAAKIGLWKPVPGDELRPEVLDEAVVVVGAVVQEHGGPGPADGAAHEAPVPHDRRAGSWRGNEIRAVRFFPARKKPFAKIGIFEDDISMFWHKD